MVNEWGRIRSSMTRVTSIMVLGVSLIVFLALFIAYILQQTSRWHHRESVLESRVVRTVLTLQQLPHSQWKVSLPLFNTEGVRWGLSHRPWPTGERVPLLSVIPESAIHAALSKQPRILSLSLPNGRWLRLRVISLSLSTVTWLSIGAALVLLIALIALCVWVTRQWQAPLEHMHEAMDRLSKDWQAGELVPVGSPQTRAVMEQFNAMQRRMKSLIVDRTLMLAAMSHDLRTPLTRLQLRLEAQPIDEWVMRGLKDVQEMAGMITSMLQYAKQYTEHEPITTFDGQALVAALCDDYQASGQALSFEGDAEGVCLQGKIRSIRRALSNIIDNALHYGEEVLVRVISDKNQLRVIVSDHGPGIPENVIDQVVQPFFRVDSARTFSDSMHAGSGLGLTVANDVISSAGGELRLSHNQPSGLVVTVQLPVV